MEPLQNVSNLIPGKQVFSLFDEFKKFAFKGNVIDLAVGVIIGGAFGKIVESMVKDVIMPSVMMFVPAEKGYETWALSYHGQNIAYGKFLSEIVNFLIVAAALFLFIVKFLGWLMKSQQAEAAAPAAPALSKDQELLMEIRDLLKQRA